MLRLGGIRPGGDSHRHRLAARITVGVSGTVKGLNYFGIGRPSLIETGPSVTRPSVNNNTRIDFLQLFITQSPAGQNGAAEVFGDNIADFGQVPGQFPGFRRIHIEEDTFLTIVKRSETASGVQPLSSQAGRLARG